jgi:hypothetical protein
MHKRIFKSIGIVAVLAASAVPSALATRVIDASGVMPLGGISVKTASTAVDQSDAFTRYVANHQAALRNVSIPYLSHGIGVDAAQFGGTGVVQTPLVQTKVVRPDDRAGARTSEPSAVVAAASTGNGFNWGDAGVGAGSALGLFLLLTLGAIATQRNRKDPLTA